MNRLTGMDKDSQLESERKLEKLDRHNPPRNELGSANPALTARRDTETIIKGLERRLTTLHLLPAFMSPDIELLSS